MDLPPSNLAPPANGRTVDGRDVEVTLHVICGRLFELEIWTGEYGDRAAPDPATLDHETWS